MKISEIARMAGVSSAAVSRYLNGGSISEEKKERIKKVIEETGYVPNPTARSLRQQRTDSIGIIFPKVNSDSVSNLIEGVSTVLSKAGYLAIFGNAENDEKRELEYMCRSSSADRTTPTSPASITTTRARLRKSRATCSQKAEKSSPILAR